MGLKLFSQRVHLSSPIACLGLADPEGVVKLELRVEPFVLYLSEQEQPLRFQVQPFLVLPEDGLQVAYELQHPSLQLNLLVFVEGVLLNALVEVRYPLDHPVKVDLVLASVLEVLLQPQHDGAELRDGLRGFTVFLIQALGGLEEPDEHEPQVLWLCNFAPVLVLHRPRKLPHDIQPLHEAKIVVALGQVGVVGVLHPQTFLFRRLGLG